MRSALKHTFPLVPVQLRVGTLLLVSTILFGSERELNVLRQKQGDTAARAKAKLSNCLSMLATSKSNSNIPIQ
jgi:hypothetical protein